MEKVLGLARAGLTAAEKGAVFAAYLEEIGLPVERVLGDLGPAEVGDVITFFYAGMPDRFKELPHRGEAPAPDHGLEALPAEYWCAAVWEADHPRPTRSHTPGR